MNMHSHKFPLSCRALEEIPDGMSGVYVFWWRAKGRCIYVGKGRSIKGRLQQHRHDSHNPTLAFWIQEFGKHLDVCYMPREESKITRLERRLIKAWRPEANRTHKPQ